VSSTCFEHPSVHLREELYIEFYGIYSCIHISSLVDVRMCLMSKTLYSNQIINEESVHFVGPYYICRECPTRYQTRHFFNNFTTNEDIATKFKADLPHCVTNVTTTNVLLFKFRCIIFIGVRIIKEMTGSVASGTPCISQCTVQKT
jgi:hypothetical protein